MRVRAPELGDHYVDSVKGLARTAYGAAGSVRVKRPGWVVVGQADRSDAGKPRALGASWRGWA